MSKSQSKSKFPQLAVLETAEWYTRDRITSVKPLFQLLSQHIYDGDPNHFHYATFTGKDSFAATFKDMVGKHGVQFIYIGAHGEDDEIRFNKQEKSGHISLFNPLFSQDVRGAASIRGVYLAGCQLDGLAKKLSSKEWEHGSTSAPWFAGYEASVNWMDAAWMDMKFWHILLDDHQSRSERGENPQSRKMDAMRTPYQLLEGGHGCSMWDLGFRIYRDGDEYVGQISDLYMEENE